MAHFYTVLVLSSLGSFFSLEPISSSCLSSSGLVTTFLELIWVHLSKVSMIEKKVVIEFPSHFLW